MGAAAVAQDLRSLSLVIPFYNESESIGPLFDRLRSVVRDLKRRWTTQLVLIDDGSRDDTFSQLEREQRRSSMGEMTLLRHSENRGLGAAMRTGFEAAEGDVVCTMDSDCTYAPEKIGEMIDLLINADADVVTGSPYHPNGEVVGVEPKRLMLSKTASRLYSMISPAKLHCYTSLFRAYRSEWASPRLSESNDFLAVTETLISAASKGARIVEFPITLGSRVHGVSKMRTASTIGAHLSLMGKTAFAHAGKVSGMLPELSAIDCLPQFPMARQSMAEAKAMAPVMDQWVLVGRVGVG